MNIDYQKVKRQLKAAQVQSVNYDRQLLSSQLDLVYERIEMGQLDRARKIFDNVDFVAKSLGWEGGGARLPRPFNHRHLDVLYWQASKLLGRGGKPRRGGVATGRFDDYSEMHLRSRLGKKPKKPFFLGGTNG